MASFTETATLKIKDLATPELGKINLAVTKLIRNMQKLQTVTAKAMSNAASVGTGATSAATRIAAKIAADRSKADLAARKIESDKIQREIEQRRLALATRRAAVYEYNAVTRRQSLMDRINARNSPRGISGALEAESFTQFLVKSGAAIIGSAIAYHFARNMGHAIQENSKELNTGITRATIMGANPQDTQSFRKAIDSGTEKLGNSFTRGQVSGAYLDVANPLGGLTQGTLPIIKSISKDALEITRIAKLISGKQGNFNLQAYEQIQNEVGGLYNPARRKEVREASYQTIATGRGLIDFSTQAYLLKMVPLTAQLTGDQLRKLFIQQGLNKGSGAQNRYPLELAAFLRDINSPTPKKFAQQQAIGIRDSRGRLYDENLLKKGDLVELEENIALRIVAQGYGIKGDKLIAWMNKRRGTPFSVRELNYLQARGAQSFIQNALRNIINNFQFARARNKDLAAAERLRPLDESFGITNQNIDQRLANTANALNDAFTGLWINIKTQSGPFLDFIRNIANRARPLLDNPDTLNAGVAAGAVGLGAYAFKKFGALGIAGTGASVLAQDPSIGLNIAAVNLNAAATALQGAAAVQAAGGVGGAAAGAAGGWTLKGLFRSGAGFISRSLPWVAGAIGLAGLSGDTKQPSELERRTLRARYDRDMAINQQMRMLNDQNNKNTLGIAFERSNALRNDARIAELQQNTNANIAAINSLAEQRKRGDTWPILDSLNKSTQLPSFGTDMLSQKISIPKFGDFQQPWQQTLQAQSDLSGALWANTDANLKNTKAQIQPDDDSKLKDPPLTPYRASNVGYRGGC